MMGWQRQLSVGFFGVAALLAATAANAGQFTAPLPPGYQPSGEKLVDGLYAEVTGLNSIYDDQEIEEFESECRADGKAVSWKDRDLGSGGAVRIYRTSKAVAVIRDTVRLVTDRKTCVARYAIERQATVKTGRWKYSDVPNFEDPSFTCGKILIFQRCTEDTVTGIDVTCLNRGDGLVGDVICVSRKHDLTRGLLVSYFSYVDDGSVPTGGWQLSKVEPIAMIDPAIFRAGPND
jgi:hypothetical protein